MIWYLSSGEQEEDEEVEEEVSDVVVSTRRKSPVKFFFLALFRPVFEELVHRKETRYVVGGEFGCGIVNKKTRC